MNFPIKDITGNKVTLKNGQSSFTWIPELPDQDQMDGSQSSGFQNGVESWLNNLNHQEWCRIVVLDGQIKLQSNQIHTIPGVNLQNDLDPVSHLNFGTQNPYFPADYGIVNSRLYRMIKLFKLPDNIKRCQLMRYGNCVINFRKLDNLRAKRLLSINRRLHFSNLTKNIRDIESENSYSESEAILEEIINGNQSLFECEAWIIIEADENETLNSITKAISDDLNVSNVGYCIENKHLAKTYENELIFGKPAFKNAHLLNTCYLAELLPLSSEKVDQEGILFETQSRNGVYLNTNNPKAINNHGLITGASGSGKSFCLNKLLFEDLQNGSKGIIFDFEKSFLKTSQYFDGQIFDQTFNPLQFKDPKYLKAVVMSFVPKQEATTKLEGHVYTLIRDFLSEKPNAENFSELIDFLDQEITDFKFYFEEYLDHFDSEIRPLKDLYFVDINLYSEKILPALILYMIETFKRLEGRRIMILEECWNLLSSVSSFVEEFYRTFRKKNASVWAVSQGFDDFTSSQIGKVIIQNSNHKLFFSQDLNSSEFLNSFDIQRISSVRSQKGRYSEFYYKSADHRKILRYFATPLEIELFNTTPGADEGLKSFVYEYQNYFSLQECIEKYVRLKYV
jgi:hypothetical protein